MNSYQRIMSAIAHKEPDCVPIAELKISPLVYQQLVPEAKNEADFCTAYGLDLVRANATYSQRSHSSNNIIDEWDIIYRSLDGGDTEHPVGHPLSAGDSLKKINLPSENQPHRLGLLQEYVEKYKNKKAVGFAMRAGFLWASALMGTAELLCTMSLHEDYIQSLFDKLFRHQAKLAVAAIRAGADIIFETDDYAYNSGPLFSPEMFSRYIVPHLSIFVQAVKNAGGILVKHTDGNIMQIIDLLLDCRIDGLHSIDPGAGMDLKEIKQKYGQKISLWGNIDCGNLLTLGNKEKIEQAVLKCIQDAAPGGGYILTSSNSITGKVPPENYAAMINAGKKYGKYDLHK